MSEPDDQPRPFAILAMPRTGSWFLVELLNQHRNIACNGEVANVDDTSGWPDGRERMFDQQLLELAFLHFPVRGTKSRVRRVGCKFLDEHTALPGRRGLIAALAKWPELSIVVLRRLSPLEALRSSKQARLTGRWQALAKNEPPAEQPRVRIEPAECSAYFERTEEFYRSMADMFARNTSAQVTYEALRDDTQAVMNGIYDLLEVPRMHLGESALLRQEQRGLRQTVENYADLRKHFAGTPYDKIFRMISGLLRATAEGAG